MDTRNGLLICSGAGRYKNIGDYIQSLAGEQFFEKVDCFVEREELDSFTSSLPTKVIMNGWFIHNAEHWPPSKDIVPLFISFHLSPRVAEKVLSKKGIAYLKQHEPIGCRDFNTQLLLSKKGINAYFSGCLTLTLGIKYRHHAAGRSKMLIFVDPYYESIKNTFGKISLYRISLNVFYGLFHLMSVKKLWKNIAYEKGKFEKHFNSLSRFCNCSSFYRAYSKKFTDEALFNAKFYTHSVSQSDFPSEKEKLDYARFLLGEYASASYVVTSRIHCALPCLALETPVIFVTSKNLESEKNPVRSPGRFGGLLELLHVMRYKTNKVVSKTDVFESGKLGADFCFKNKADYLKLKEKLSAVCEMFANTPVGVSGDGYGHVVQSGLREA